MRRESFKWGLEQAIYSKTFSFRLGLALIVGLVSLIVGNVLFVIAYPHFSDFLSFSADVDREGNFATWYNSTIDLLVGLAAFGIAWISAKHRTTENAKTHTRSWTLAGIVFVYLGMDDASQIHERFGAQLRNQVEVLISGIVSHDSLVWKMRWYAWIPVLTVVGCIVGFYLIRLWRQTIRKSTEAKWLVLSGFCFLASNPMTESLETIFTRPSNGLDVPHGPAQQIDPSGWVWLKSIVLVQETTEMLGVILILWGFLLYGDFLLRERRIESDSPAST